jgi:hypothetical protein
MAGLDVGTYGLMGRSTLSRSGGVNYIHGLYVLLYEWTLGQKSTPATCVKRYTDGLVCCVTAGRNSLPLPLPCFSIRPCSLFTPNPKCAEAG